MALSSDLIGQRSETVRRANLSTILRELHLAGPLSRSDLVAHSGLTRTGIKSLTAELAAAGLVSEERASPDGSPGRPSAVVSPNPTTAAVLALEVAVDSIAAAVVGLGGTVHQLTRIDRPPGHSSIEATVADLVGLARTVRIQSGLPDAIVGVGVAVVGTTRRSDGFVSFAPNLGWHDVSLGNRLAAALGLPEPIAVANDADLGVLAEHRRGAAIGADNVLLIWGEVGIGGGLIIDGRPMTGAAGYGGEVGHIPVNADGRPCQCGSVGCWETEIGEGALLLRAGRSADGGREEVEQVLAEAAAGSPAALAALDDVGRWLGFGLAGLVNVLNPQLVVLGGLFGRAYQYAAQAMLTELERRALPASRSMVQIVPATLGINAPLLGAAELAFEPLLADPAAWMVRSAFAPDARRRPPSRTTPPPVIPYPLNPIPLARARKEVHRHH